MQEQEVIEAIKYMQKYQTETEKLEAKTAKGEFPKKCYDTISSFSNTSGGIIIFGINENNNFIEQDVYDVNDLQKQVTALCSTAMEPKIRPEFLPITYNGKKLLAVKIEELPQIQKTCYYKSLGIQKGSFTRVGDSDEHMTEYEIYSLESYKSNVQEDLRPIPRANLEDFKQDKLKKYIEKMKIKKPNFANFSDEKILALSGIIDSKTGEPTLAGTLLSAEWPQAYLPQLFIACVVVPGRKLGDIGELGQRFDDNERVEGTIEEMLEGALNFVRRNIGTMVIIDNDGKRTDVPHYPMKAIKEAIANALIHRDYSIFREGAYIYVQIYDDRIEVISPGGLYGKCKLENLGTNQMMESRNKTIVQILEETTDIVENRHTGIATMREEMKNMNLPEPEIEVSEGDFRVIFRKKVIDDGGQKRTEEDRRGQINETKKIEAKIIELMEKNPQITQSEICRLTGLGRTAITRRISKLKEANIIERIGSDRNGYWKISHR